MSAITTSIVVNFSKENVDEDGILMAEIDDRDDGLNGGVTNFLPGDTAWFLVYKSPNVTYDQPVLTAGSLGFGSPGSRAITDEIITVSGNTVSTQYPALQPGTAKWLGRSGGSIDWSDPNTITIKPLSAGAPIFGVLVVSYTAAYQSYSIKSPESLEGFTTFPIVAFISGKVVKKP